MIGIKKTNFIESTLRIKFTVLNAGWEHLNSIYIIRMYTITIIQQFNNNNWYARQWDQEDE